MRVPAIAGLVVAAAVGCASTETVPVEKPLAARPVPPRTGVLSTGLLPLGGVPYDHRSLPLVSPDGQFIATQNGDPPTWETLLASPEASVPASSRVEIYHLDRRLGDVAFFRATDPMLLLGRAADERGFLVESVRPNGARWIGFVTWYSGPVSWLADDDHVNAFACLGAGGRLAWSRRHPDAEHFDLVVRREGEEWTIGSQGGDWLLPAWSRHGDSLFALRLEDGRLEAAYMIATSPESTRTTLVRLPLAAERTVHEAYQCMAARAVTIGAPGLEEPMLVFWHPTADRIALWRPVTSPSAAILLEPRSIAAAIDPGGFIVLATAQRLIIQNPASPADQRTLLPGTHIPRGVARTDWPYVLLSPYEDKIGVMAMRILRD